MHNKTVKEKRRDDITFCSWNVNGINEPVKRGKVLAHLKSLQVDIIFLQETHLKNDSHARLRCRWIQHIYHSNFSVKARGTAILIRRGVPFKHLSTIVDRDGRYVIVVGEIHSTPITLLNVYGPNNDDPEFFRKVLNLIPDISSTNLIIGGDFNLVLDTYLDRSSTQRVEPSKACNLLKSYIENMNVSDVWRISNATGREYSFHSKVHNVYTRIDFFLVDGKLLPLSYNAKYHNIIISDHSPVSFSLKLGENVPIQRSWRFNPQLTTDAKFCEYLESNIKIYFETNDKNDTSPTLLWEACKAYLRGCIISFQSSLKKRNKAIQLELEKEIHQLDIENAQQPSSEKHTKISTLKYKLNKILSDRICRAFIFTKQRYFEFGDKPHKLLARQLRKLENDRTIHRIKSGSGNILTSPKDINDRFRQFYETLYTSESTSLPETMQSFLDECELPSLSQTDRDALEADITCEELLATIGSMKNAKSPGPDGFSIEIYKKFGGLLAPYLGKLYTQSYDDGVLPQTLTEATIILLPKKGKDLEEVGSYRPISLLNTDQKILAKTMARRLNAFMGKLVHPDQTGFIPNRNSFHNFRRLLNIMHSPRLPKKDLIILTLDAEKAFDRVEWPYLFAVLQKFNCGEKFVSWTKLLYNGPCARILTNRTLSTPFQLGRGTRQGCPLSPLLFALAIEPLAETIRSHPEIHGYNTEFTKNTISLYADDILLYVTQPMITIPSVLKMFNLFGTFSGYKINWSKSELLPVQFEDQDWLKQLPFHIISDNLTYLGIVITKNYNALYKANFPVLLNKLEHNIQFWRTLPISLLGRVNAIKMIFLPQLLYLFQNLPIYLTKSFFRKLDSIILPFIWNYKSHRIKKDHLCKHKTNGGLALPNFILYYWATGIRSIAHWLDDTPSPFDGLEMEREDCLPFSIRAVMLSPVPVKRTCFKHNPIIHDTIRIWKQLRKHFKLNAVSFLLPIAANPTFTPSVLDGTFNTWKQIGICNVGNLYIEGTFASFQQLQEKYNLPKNQFFRYLQIRDYVRTHLPNFENAVADKLESFIKLFANSRYIISQLYDTLQSMCLPKMDKIKEEWEKEIGAVILPNVWEESLEYIHDCSINARHCLIQFKILHRLHFSKTKLHKIFPEVSPLCDKCESMEATLSHSYALCPKLQYYWVEIFRFLSVILKVQIEPDPILIILGISEELRKLNVAQQRLLAYGLIAAKKLILLLWKKKEVPSFKHWLTDLTDTLHLERIRFILKDKLRDFQKIWQPLISHLDRELN